MIYNCFNLNKAFNYYNYFLLIYAKELFTMFEYVISLLFSVLNFKRIIFSSFLNNPKFEKIF